MREDDNDLGVEFDFFCSRSRKKDVKPQKTVPVEAIRKPADLIIPKKKRGRGIGNAYQHTKTGARQDLGGVVARSTWEADTMRILQLWGISWEFEPQEFAFPLDAKGRSSMYIPDIYLPKTNEFIEVKGMLDARGRSKLRKFKKFYPDEFSRLTVVISKSNKTNKFFFNKLGVKNILYYENLSKLFSKKIIMWEGK